MPQLTPLTASALAVAAILLLPGCTGDAPLVLPSPESSTAPVFASDEEALAAAEAAYGEYLEASNAITKPDGKDPESIAEYVDAEYAPELIEGFRELRKGKLYLEGSSSFDTVELQQYADDFASPASIVLYLCLDVSQTRVVNANGVDVTPQRPERVPLEVGFETEDRSQALLLTSSESWTGDNFCVA